MPRSLPARRPVGARVTLGTNARRTAGWRDRIIQVAGQKSYREIANETINTVNPIAFTTIRSVMTDAAADVRLGTLVGVCDAINADLAYVLGYGQVAAVSPDNRVKLAHIPSVAILPVIPLARAHAWPDRWSTVTDGADVVAVTGAPAGLMAVRASDNAMHPIVSKGDVVLFRAGKPTDGALVLVEIERQDHTILRPWKTSKDGRVRLEPADADYGIINADRASTRVVGIVTAVHKALS